MTVDIDDRDVATAVESLSSAAFTQRFVRAEGNGDAPVWMAPGGQPIEDHVGDRMDTFKKDVETVRLHHFHGGVLQRFDADTVLTIAGNRRLDPAPPAARDLFHVYGPDRDNLKDWKRYYRYAWKDKGPHAIVYSDDTQIVREGKLACSSYAYSGQSSYVIVGAGMLFRPQFGDAKISVRPSVQWLTSASFTGTESAPASATANLGIYIESWSQSGGGHYADRDRWIPVWSQNTQSYLTNLSAGGTATPFDGLCTEILAVTQRKYSIFVYVYLETSAAPPQQRNELRFVRIDMDATVPYVVVEETLV